MYPEKLKQKVYSYWNSASCGTEFIGEQKFSAAYFQAIEDFRYSIEPEIHAFAQFTLFHKKKVLEVGVGAGTDFVQWVRAGAYAYGIDLTDEAIENTRHRLSLAGLNAQELNIADAEKLPYADNTFDLVYSWGVIHHSPDTAACLKEMIRVTKPGGSIKIMIYNRHSLFAFYRYLKTSFMRGKPFRKIKTVLYNYQESPGTKAFTFKEVRTMLQSCPVSVVQLNAPVTKHDLLYYKKSRLMQFFTYCAASIFGWNRAGWFMLLNLKKQ